MSARFVSEPIQPIVDSIDTRRLALGEPGMPGRFIWRGVEYSVKGVLASWHETGSCRSGSGEQYVRKHWFIVCAANGAEMKIYFERQAKSGRERTSRWWLYTITEPDCRLRQNGKSAVMNSRDIEMVIFDLDDTLCNTRQAFSNAKNYVNNSLIEAGIDTIPFWQRYESVVNGLYNRAMDGELDWREYRRLRFMIPLQGMTDDYESLADTLSSIFTNEINGRIASFDDTIPILEMLGEIGIKRMLLTNGPSWGQRQKIKNSALEDHLDGIFISEELKCAKPDPAIFEYVMASAEIDPNHAVMVGDSIENDMVGADNAGIMGILMDRFNEHEDYDGHKIRRLDEMAGILQIASIESYAK